VFVSLHACMSQPRSSRLFPWLRQRSQARTVLKANEKRNLFFFNPARLGMGVLGSITCPPLPCITARPFLSFPVPSLCLHHVSPYADFGARGKIRRCPPVRTASTPYEQLPIAPHCLNTLRTTSHGCRHASPRDDATMTSPSSELGGERDGRS
jgi:hypothetical protein